MKWMGQPVKLERDGEKAGPARRSARRIPMAGAAARRLSVGIVLIAIRGSRGPHLRANRRTGLCNCRECPVVVSSFGRVRFAENSRLYFLHFTVVRLLISVAICLAISLFVLVQVTIAI
jgi:hypothetical protein